MTEDNLGTLERLDLRSTWPTERDFSAWLAENIDLLNDALGIDIELVEQEVPVGDFKLDLFGKAVGSGTEVVIENQLEPTDHSHLGQLMTYAAGREARTVVWIASQFREEHRQAIDWLNRHTDEGVSFFGVELELLQIGESDPAPNLNLVAEPSDWQKQIGTAGRRPLTEKQLAYHDFFADMLERLKTAQPGFTRASRAGYDNWMVFGAGRMGFTFVPEFMRRPDRFVVQLNITTGDRDDNKTAFDQLTAQKEAIEIDLGESLEWKSLDDKAMCRIGIHRLGSIESGSQELDEMKDWAVDLLPRFREVFGERIKAIDLDAQDNEGSHTG